MIERAAGEVVAPADEDELDHELRDYYLESAPGRQAALAAALLAARAAPGDEAGIGKLRDLVHRTAGSAGMYGFHALSRAAKALEASIIDASARLPAPPALFDDIDAFCAKVVAELAKAREVPAAAAPAEPGGAASPGPAVLGETRRRLVVAVLGGGPDNDEVARDVGRELAHAGTHLLIARANGASLEAARSFREHGAEGLVLAALAGEDRTVAAPWVDLPLPTGLGPGLASLLPLWADAAVTIGGGPAALAELALFLHQGKPVVALQGTGGAALAAASASFDGRAPLLARDATSAVLGLLQALAEAPAGR